MPDVSAGIVAMGPVPGAGDTAVNLPASPPISQQFVILTDSSFLSYRQCCIVAVLVWVSLHICNGPARFENEYSVQITEALLS
ncbi:TPA: hypothetical protein ACHJN2_RS26465, partial [Escherichia coli]